MKNQGPKPIRILRIIARMNIGGPAIQITGLMQNLPRPEFEQVLLYGRCGPEELDYLDEHKIEFTSIRLEGFGRRISFKSDLKAFLTIRSLIKTFKPDIVHTHTAKAGFIGRLAAISVMRKKIKIHTYHGHLLHGYFSPFITKIVIWSERLLAYFSHSLIAVGARVRNELLESGIGEPEKYQVIGPGLGIGELPSRKLSLETFGLPNDKFTVTWIGRVVSVKAPHRIIEIALECVTRGLNVQFVLVGDGPLLEELRETSQLAKLPIVFLGWQSKIEKILSFSDLVILTSENEGTPVSLIQAQLAGIPVLTTDVGSASEVMIDGKTGFCLHYSAKDFAERIELLANSPELRAEFIGNSMRNAREKFPINRLVLDHAQLYRNLISQSKSSSKVPR